MTGTDAGIKGQFRYIGTTSDVVECEKCGKVELRNTVVIVPLGAEGNDDGDPCYYGSVCAARALAVKGGGASVRKAAEGARVQTLMAAHDARRMLRVYGLPEVGDLDDDAMFWATQTYGKYNPGAVRASFGYSDLRRYVLDMLDRKRSAIREAVLVAGENWAADRQPYEWGYGARIRQLATL